MVKVHRTLGNLLSCLKKLPVTINVCCFQGQLKNRGLLCQSEGDGLWSSVSQGCVQTLGAGICFPES